MQCCIQWNRTSRCRLTGLTGVLQVEGRPNNSCGPDPAQILRQVRDSRRDYRKLLLTLKLCRQATAEQKAHASPMCPHADQSRGHKEGQSACEVGQPFNKACAVRKASTKRMQASFGVDPKEQLVAISQRPDSHEVSAMALRLGFLVYLRSVLQPDSCEAPRVAPANYTWPAVLEMYCFTVGWIL